MKFTRAALLALVFATTFAASTFAANDSQPLGEPVMEKPTLLCLGMHWIITGDDNKNAAITVQYQKSPTTERAMQMDAWHQGPPLFRVSKDLPPLDHGNSLALQVPADATLFAGSIVLLEPDTAYTIKLTLTDPDGAKIEKTLAGHTRAEPVLPKDGPVIHVLPENANGVPKLPDGAKSVRGLAAAQQMASPGTTLLLHAGIYPGTFTITKSGEEGKPIVYMAAGDGEAIIDGKGDAEKRPGRAIDASNIHDVWFNGLTIRNADYGLVGHDSTRLVIQRCHIHDIEHAITATRNTKDQLNDWFILDNVMEGPSVWPRSKGIEDARGVEIAGSGHVVAYNRVRAFADAIDTFQGPRCEDIDFHNNDCSELTDDGFEMDYSQRNTRNFHNRMTNVFQGLSVQPVFGGPVYLFRNVLYNVGLEPFKMHNGPSGAIFYHNTVVKTDFAVAVLANDPMNNCVWRNNLFIGTTSTKSNYLFECMAPAKNCDFDYCGFGGGPFKMFLKWNNSKYATLDEAKAKSPIFHHSIMVDPAKLFASGVTQPTDVNVQVKTPPDLRLSDKSEAIDAGEILPGFNDNFAGKAPDLGAYEFGQELPHYGPRNQNP